ncbi:MAG TPA: hypothetical protein VMM79_15570 [Longimicrobiales bacterium]|nr:hypothetical protein [Longimicrobiales bacterium]
MKTVWVQLMRDDENTVSDPVSSQIEYRMRPRFLSIEPRVFNNRKPATLTIEVTGLSADIGNIVNARTVAGISYCGFYEYNSALGEALVTYAGGVVTDPERVVAQSVTSLDDETFRFIFYGIFNVQDRAQSGCKLGLSAELVGLDGQSLGGLSVYEGDALVQVIQPEPREEIVVENTYDLLPYLEISDANIVNSNSFGLCDGTLVGPAGSFPVGVMNAGGDLALVTRSAPSGTTGDRTISAPTLRGGWRMDIEFAEETSGTVCAVSRDGTPKDGRPTKFAFNRLVTFVGWEKSVTRSATVTPARTGATRGSRPMSSLRVASRCRTTTRRGPC